jgi:hypothetical protein
MPRKAGMVRGHKTTAAQQRLMGAARGAQESGKKTFPAAQKIANTVPPAKLHQMAKKPKGGFRKP